MVVKIFIPLLGLVDGTTEGLKLGNVVGSVDGETEGQAVGTQK